MDFEESIEDPFGLAAFKDVIRMHSVTKIARADKFDEEASFASEQVCSILFQQFHLYENDASLQWGMCLKSMDRYGSFMITAVKTEDVLLTIEALLTNLLCRFLKSDRTLTLAPRDRISVLLERMLGNNFNLDKIIFKLNPRYHSAEEQRGEHPVKTTFYLFKNKKTNLTKISFSNQNVRRYNILL